MPQTISKSFHSLTVEHPGLAKHPLQWTAHHLSVVNCNFQQVEPDDTHDAVILDTKTAESLTRAAVNLALGASHDMKSFSAGDVLLGNKATPITFMHAPVSFYYGRQRVRLADSDIDLYCIKKEISIPHADPIIGYYSYKADKERKQGLRARRAPRGLSNKPGQNICDILYRRVTPDDWRHDPYLLCILLSLAQLQDRKGLGPGEGLFLARLFVTNLTDLTNAYVYKADIPHQLLDSLECPTRTIEDFVFPTINYVAVPFEPYSTFAERIQVQLAGTEYSSPPGPVRSDQASSSVPQGEKRKREDE